MTTLLKSATIIDSSSPYHKQTKDILIVDGVITSISDDITSKDEYKLIELDNLHVSVGWFDSSVSFGEPGYEDRETITNGLEVALKSGFTAVAIQPNTNPITDNKAGIQFIKNQAISSKVDVYPIGALTQESKGVEMAELYDMQQSGAIAFGDYNKATTNDNLMKIALLYAQNFDGLVLSFPKNKQIAGEGVVNEGVNSTRLGLKGIPALAEELQISRDLFLLEYTGGKLHIPTISTAKSVELIKNAKEKGLQVTCSAAIHNLVLTDDELHVFNARYKVTPPLRTEEDRKALVKAVEEGIIDCITSDHNPIDIEDKKVEFSIAKDGTIGLESAFSALQTVLSTETIITNLTNKPRKIFNIKQTELKEGQQANLTLFNPEGEYTFTEKHIFSSSKNSIFIDKKLKGNVYGTFSKNTLTIKN